MKIEKHIKDARLRYFAKVLTVEDRLRWLTHVNNLVYYLENRNHPAKKVLSVYRPLDETLTTRKQALVFKRLELVYKRAK